MSSTDFAFTKPITVGQAVADQAGYATKNPLAATSWQQALKDVVTSRTELLQLLQLPVDDQLPLDNGGGQNQASGVNPASSHFPLRVPRSFVARMELGNPQDPLLLQVLPQAAEQDAYPGYSTDPLAEAEASPVPGLLHKFKDRVLLVISGACAVHCRYCFRQHFPYGDHVLSPRRIDAALDYIRQHPGIAEVILSGGDPLSVKDSMLDYLQQSLAAIPHVQRLRIHTRLPIVIPQRVDQGLLQVLAKTRLQKIVVVHCNHPREINDDVAAAMGRLCALPQLTLLNQTVLLRHINDDPVTLARLSHALFAAGVLPYYLHRLDPVQGAQHFAVDHSWEQKIMWRLLELLPGYLVPKLVEEQPGLPSKKPVGLGPCPWG